LIVALLVAPTPNVVIDLTELVCFVTTTHAPLFASAQTTQLPRIGLVRSILVVVEFKTALNEANDFIALAPNFID
jgi:hypothetical protein